MSQMKQVEQKFNTTHYLVKQLVLKRSPPQLNHLYVEKVTFGDVETSPVQMLNSAPGLFREKTASDFCVTFD